MTDEPLLTNWLRDALKAAGLAPDAVECDERSVKVMLDLARDAAHHVARPAAPLATFVLGLAMSPGASPEALQRTASLIASRALLSDESVTNNKIEPVS